MLCATPQRAQCLAVPPTTQLHEAKVRVTHGIALVRGRSKPVHGSCAIARHAMRTGVVEVAHAKLAGNIADIG